MRKVILHNRKDTNVRRPQHDLDAIPEFGDATSGIMGCDPCDCLGVGTNRECELCPHGAPGVWEFFFPEESAYVHEGEAPGADVSRTLAHATDCTWEGDAIEIVCDESPNEFGWNLIVIGRASGENTLVFERLSASGCRATKIVYRNFFPWQCTCANAMLLSRDECENVDLSILPCTICLRAGATCELTNWRADVEEIGTWQTDSDPTQEGGVGNGCYGTFSGYDTAISSCARYSPFVNGITMDVAYMVGVCTISADQQHTLIASFGTARHADGYLIDIVARYAVRDIDPEVDLANVQTLRPSSTEIGIGPTNPDEWPEEITLTPVP